MIQQACTTIQENGESEMKHTIIMKLLCILKYTIILVLLPML
jgi:hypothetical protein